MAHPLQQAEDTTAEGDRAGSWKRDCERKSVGVPGPKRVPELPMGYDMAGMWCRAFWLGRLSVGWGNDGTVFGLEFLVKFPLK